ncbi:MAG: hypothetical protein ACC660_03475 [Acidimicrobiales bacterium]
MSAILPALAVAIVLALVAAAVGLRRLTASIAALRTSVDRFETMPGEATHGTSPRKDHLPEAAPLYQRGSLD